jgi:anti-sigma B factor antagonist
MAEPAATAGTPGIEVRDLAGWTVVAPATAVTHENCERLESALREGGNGHRTKIILDCRSVSLMDSAALELLVGMQAQLEELGGGLKIANLNDVCKDILLVTRLQNVFQVYGDIGKAVRSGTGK